MKWLALLWNLMFLLMIGDATFCFSIERYSMGTTNLFLAVIFVMNRVAVRRTIILKIELGLQLMDMR